jgi:acyl-CoA dehydrogenase
MIERARPLTLKAARMMDTRGNKKARTAIAMIKVAAPQMACRVIDWAIQAFGGAGVSDDYRLAYAYATARVLRLADGPDEVHRNQSARLKSRKYQGPASLTGGSAEVLPPDFSHGAGFPDTSPAGHSVLGSASVVAGRISEPAA